MDTNPDLPAIQQHKSLRKISLPWFRQSSVSAPHVALSRQHTIDTPSSFQARLHKGNRQQQAEITSWVIAEHNADSAGELTVTKGQQVEVLESWQARTDWWLVRIPGDPPQEGAVPAQVLKPQPQHHPQQKTSPSRRPLSQPCDEAIEGNVSDSGNKVNVASPGKQPRRVFSGRRWLGLRKTSQGKTPSGALCPASNIADKSVSLKKIPLEKKLKSPYANDNESVEGEEVAAGTLEETDDDVPDVELPPPMKPIKDPQTVMQAATPATNALVSVTSNSLSADALETNCGPADISEIEQIVKEKMVRFKS